MGRVNAISGAPEEARLHADPQDYVVCPEQLWLDGIHTGQNAIRQFVAMPLGLGYSVEASVTGTEQFGGMQITVFEPQPGKFPEERQSGRHPTRQGQCGLPGYAARQRHRRWDLGLRGGCGKRSILDPYGLDTWDQDNYVQVFVYILNSAQFFAVTGLEAPATPIDAKVYTDSGLPGSYSMTKVPVTPLSGTPHPGQNHCRA